MNTPVPHNISDEQRLKIIEAQKETTLRLHGAWALSIMIFSKPLSLTDGELAKLKHIGEHLMEGIDDYPETIKVFDPEFNNKIQSLNKYMVLHIASHEEARENMALIITSHLEKLPYHPSREQALTAYKAIIDSCFNLFQPSLPTKENIVLYSQEQIVSALKKSA